MDSKHSDLTTDLEELRTCASTAHEHDGRRRHIEIFRERANAGRISRTFNGPLTNPYDERISMLFDTRRL